MYTKSLVMIITLCVAVPTAATPPDEEALKQRYDAFVESLDHRTLAKDYPGAVRNLDSADPKRQMIGAAEPDDAHARPDDLVSELRELGLHITADQKMIKAATSEAAYFMFADRKEHRPKCRTFNLPDEGQWLEGKPLFGPEADKQRIYPLFNRLVEIMGYNEVCIYDADLHYGVSSYADFTLYKLGYRKHDKRRRKKPDVLLGDAEYVINLP